jgi:RNA polymerase sigma-70 factor (ECF subfamily)
MAARRTRAARARQDDGVEVDELTSAAQPHDDLVSHRRTDRLRELLAGIAPEQAETLTLRVVLGWSLPEVAAATGAPLNTVRSRIRLAKEALRSAIERDPRLTEELGSPAGSGEPGASDDV